MAVSRQNPNAWSEKDDDILRADWANNVHVTEIALKLGRSVRSIYGRTYTLRLPARAAVQGAGPGISKLNHKRAVPSLPTIPRRQG